ncbi:hypothetical protein EMIT0111MI5_10157 [Burkholderia sp. IT-111MI5]
MGQGPSSLQFRKQREFRRLDGSRPAGHVLLGRRRRDGLGGRRGGGEKAGLTGDTRVRVRRIGCNMTLDRIDSVNP